MTISFSDNITDLAAALAQAQASMGSAQLDSKNGHFRSRYASLASCLHACLPALAANNLSLLQHPGFDPSSQIVTVTTCILHGKTGQWMKSTCCLPLGGKKDGHALKSATTYLRRIAIVSILGLPEEDDDGNATSAVGVRRAAPQPVAPAPKVSKDDLKMYQKKLKEAGLDPKLAAAFMSDHGKPPAAELTGDILHKRMTWLIGNVGTIVKWGEER